MPLWGCGMATSILEVYGSGKHEGYKNSQRIPTPRKSKQPLSVLPPRVGGSQCHHEACAPYPYNTPPARGVASDFGGGLQLSFSEADESMAQVLLRENFGVASYSAGGPPPGGGGGSRLRRGRLSGASPQVYVKAQPPQVYDNRGWAMTSGQSGLLQEYNNRKNCG